MGSPGDLNGRNQPRTLQAKCPRAISRRRGPPVDKRSVARLAFSHPPRPPPPVQTTMGPFSRWVDAPVSLGILRRGWTRRLPRSPLGSYGLLKIPPELGGANPPRPVRLVSPSAWAGNLPLFGIRHRPAGPAGFTNPALFACAALG